MHRLYSADFPQALRYTAARLQESREILMQKVSESESFIRENIPDWADEAGRAFFRHFREFADFMDKMYNFMTEYAHIAELLDI